MLKIPLERALWTILLLNAHPLQIIQSRAEADVREVVRVSGNKYGQFGKGLGGSVEHLRSSRGIRSTPDSEDWEKNHDHHDSGSENEDVADEENTDAAAAVSSAAEKNSTLNVDADADDSIVFCEIKTLWINDVMNIDESAATITLNLYVIITWALPSAAFQKEHFELSTTEGASRDKYVVKPDKYRKIWKVDIYFHNDANSYERSLTSKPIGFQYNANDSTYTYFSRQSITLNCDMDFTYYPADTQRCTTHMAGYFPGKTVFLHLDKYTPGGAQSFVKPDPNFYFQLESGFRGLEGRNGTNNTLFEKLEFTISWSRKLSYHFVQTYLTSFFFILIACLCFLVPSSMIETRIGIAMTTLLTLTSMFASVRQSTPTVSYVKAIDVWMVGCISLVFFILLEFTTILWLRNKREIAEKAKLQNQKKLLALKKVIGEDSLLAGTNSEFRRSFSVESVRFRRHEIFAETIEKYGLLVFTSVFIVFSIIYWIWLIVSSGYLNWEIDPKLNLSPEI